MVLYRRNYIAGGTFFFTVALRDRRADLLLSHADLLKQAFAESKAERPFYIEAMVVMPEHLHAIWTLPKDDADYSGRWQAIKSRFVRALAKRGIRVARNARGEADVWQRRFWEHTIRDENDLNRHIDYIHYNPVKHGYVDSPAQWSHSSIHQFIEKGLLTADWGNSLAMDSGNFGEA